MAMELRCVAGYAGAQCDKCAPGFYNFPNCRACNCHPAGTLPQACTSVIYRVFRKKLWVFFTVHCNPSLAYTAGRDLQ